MSSQAKGELKIDDFYRDGSLVIQNGFACGDWNDEGKGIWQLRPFNISNIGTIELTAKKFVETDRDITPYLLQPHDVIFNNTNSEDLVGKVALWTQEERAVLSNHMTILRVIRHDRLCPEFIALYLLKRWFDGYFHTICRRHVNQASVSIERIRDTTFPPFGVFEQRKIAGVLGLVQRAIEQQERLIAKTAELKKALLHHLFTHGLRNEPQKQTEIGPIPESWEVKELGKLAAKISKGSSPRWQGFEYKPVKVLFVRSQNVGDDRMDFTDRVFVSPEFNEREKRSILKDEDILVNLVGASIGRLAAAYRASHRDMVWIPRIVVVDVLAILPNGTPAECSMRFTE